MAEKDKKAAAPRHPAVQGGEGAEAAKGDGQVASTADEARQRQSKLRTTEPAGSGDQGPGTRQEAPSEDPAPGSTKYQARMHIGNGHVAAPIEAPDAQYQEDPPEGHSRSSTNPIAALTGVQTYTGENHVDLVDEDGNPLDPEAIFEEADPGKTFRVAKQRVYERFQYAGSQQQFTRLLYPAGHRVGLAEAVRLGDAQHLGKLQLKQETEAIEAEAKAFPTPAEN